MADRILEIGKSALETSDMKARMLMNNVVNAQTPGYKKSDVVTNSFPLALENATKTVEGRNSSSLMAPQTVGTYNNLQQGALFKTGGVTDLAIGGEGYFVVQSSEGEVFTRDGRMYIDESGRLVTQSGNFPVLGQGGPITVMPGSKLEISKYGSVMVDDAEIDKIRVVKFENPKELRSMNNSFFKIPPEGLSYQEEQNPNIAQGFIESSNVSVIDEMTNLISVQKSYELAAKIVRTREGNLQSIIEIGRPSQ